MVAKTVALGAIAIANTPRSHQRRLVPAHVPIHDPRLATAMVVQGLAWELGNYPRPTKGICVAIIVRKRTLASSGKLAIVSTAWPTWFTSIVGSGAILPLACMTPKAIRAVRSVP